MNYMKHYIAIVYDRKFIHPINKVEQYCEKHHIVPRSINKSLIKDKSNLVYLTPREHYICHRLLEKITRE